MDGVGAVLPITNGLDREGRAELEPLEVAVSLDELAELVVGLQPTEEAAKLVVVVLMLQSGLVLEEFADSRHETAQKLSPILVGGEERSADGAKEDDGLHGLGRTWRVSVGIKFKEHFDGGRVLQDVPPRRRGLDRADIFGRFVGICPNEVEVETPDHEGERLLAEDGLLSWIGNCWSGRDGV